MRSWTTANPVTRGCVALTVLGLVTAVIGTFLPWLRSGNVHRDSHTAAAVIGQLLPSDTNVAVLLRAWNVLPLIATVCVVLLVLGWWRTAGDPHRDVLDHRGNHRGSFERPKHGCGQSGGDHPARTIDHHRGRGPRTPQRPRDSRVVPPERHSPQSYEIENR